MSFLIYESPLAVYLVLYGRQAFGEGAAGFIFARNDELARIVDESKMLAIIDAPGSFFRILYIFEPLIQLNNLFPCLSMK